MYSNFRTWILYFYDLDACQLKKTFKKYFKLSSYFTVLKIIYIDLGLALNQFLAKNNTIELILIPENRWSWSPIRDYLDTFGPQNYFIYFYFHFLHEIIYAGHNRKTWWHEKSLLLHNLENLRYVKNLRFVSNETEKLSKVKSDITNFSIEFGKNILQRNGDFH